MKSKMTNPKHKQKSFEQDIKTETYCDLLANGGWSSVESVIIATDLWELGSHIAIKKKN